MGLRMMGNTIWGKMRKNLRREKLVFKIVEFVWKLLDIVAVIEILICGEIQDHVTLTTPMATPMATPNPKNI